MNKPTFNFNLRHWLWGMNWEKSTVDQFTCHFLSIHFGPFLWTWNLSRGVEWIDTWPFYQNQ